MVEFCYGWSMRIGINIPNFSAKEDWEVLYHYCSDQFSIFSETLGVSDDYPHYVLRLIDQTRPERADIHIFLICALGKIIIVSVHES